MAKEKHEGICRICGMRGRLSFEHTPPRAAGNESHQKAFDIAHHLKTDPDAPASQMRIKKLPRGSGGYYLCEPCNNFTGGKYAKDYGIWARQGELNRQALGDVNSLALPFHIFPARVFKQIISIFGATCQEGLFNANPDLRRIVLDPDYRNIPDKVRLFCYIVNRESRFSRQSGVVVVLRGVQSYCFSEFSFRPFGYILTLSGTPPMDRALFDITFFGHHSYNQYRDLHLPIPVRSVETYFPGDFRNKTEWDAVNKRLGDPK